LQETENQLRQLLSRYMSQQRPSPPPGVGQTVSTILSWIMWGGWIAVAAAFILGAIEFARGDNEKGKKYVVGAVIAAVIMAFYTAIITGLIG